MEFFNLSQNTFIEDTENNQLLLVNVLDLSSHRVSVETIKSTTLEGLSHDSLSGIGTSSHIEIDEAIDDLSLHLADPNLHISTPMEITPLITGGWAPVGSPWATPGYCKDKFGKVTLWGEISGGAVAAGTIILTLMEGYRPTNNHLFLCALAATFCKIVVYPDGTVRNQSDLPTNAALSLDGIGFYLL